VRQLFENARAAAPCVVFLDQLHNLAPPRTAGSAGRHTAFERLVAIILTELDGITSTGAGGGGGGGAAAGLSDGRLVVVAAAPAVSLIDPALTRAGRLDTHILVGPPDDPCRTALLRKQLATTAAEADRCAVGWGSRQPASHVSRTAQRRAAGGANDGDGGLVARGAGRTASRGRHARDPWRPVRHHPAAAAPRAQRCVPPGGESVSGRGEGRRWVPSAGRAAAVVEREHFLAALAERVRPGQASVFRPN
jgi:SpoVK/Ycf46/Vps4 family AAA+-type ATPase